MTTPVVALIVNFNSGALLGHALDGLSAQAIEETVVVDNASHDLSWEAARGRDGVRLERLDQNVGFAGAVNRGLALSSAPYVLFLNADVELGEGYVERLGAILDADPTRAAVTGALVLPAGGLDSTGIALSTARWATDRDRGLDPSDATTAEPFGVSGAAGLFRREALEQVGGLWEDLFVYWEDVELAWRLRRAGWGFAVDPEALAVHQRGSDSADPTFVEAASFGNRLATVARHEGWAGLLRPGTLAVTLVVAARLALRHRRALRTSRPRASIRKGLEARRVDALESGQNHGPIPFSPHPWVSWMSAQVSGGRQGLGATDTPPRGPHPQGT